MFNGLVFFSLMNKNTSLFVLVIVWFFHWHDTIIVVAGASHRYMDKKQSGKEAAEELTRESLIAISYSVPDKDNSQDLPSPNKGSDNGVADINDEKAEKIRSELISISYAELPNINTPPACPVEPKA